MDENLYEAWLKKEARLAFEREHGTTLDGVSLATVDLPNGWTARITGPWEPMPRDCFESDYAYRKAKKLHKAYNADLEISRIEGRLWGTKSFEADSYEEALALSRAHASDRSNIYDPDRTWIDGRWVDRADIPGPLEAWKRRQDEKFERDKQEYLKARKQDASGPSEVQPGVTRLSEAGQNS
jgi:hypothetical protein